MRQALADLCDKGGNIYAPFASFVHDSCTSLCETIPLSIQPSAVSRSCSTSRSFHSGILLLEKLLHPSRALPEPSAKRSRTAGQTSAQALPRDNLWYELARIHKDIGEDDVVRGIFRCEVLPLSPLALSEIGDLH